MLKEKKVSEVILPQTLEQTIAPMVSDDYKQRFIAEYCQLKIRFEKLQAMLDKWDSPVKVLDFMPTCPRSTYEFQIRAMEDYLMALEARAKMEGINIE